MSDGDRNAYYVSVALLSFFACVSVANTSFSTLNLSKRFQIAASQLDCFKCVTDMTQNRLRRDTCLFNISPGLFLS